MNLLEHYIIKVLESRPLNQQEIDSFKKYREKVDDMIFVKWEASCYGSHSIVEDYYRKESWDNIVKKGYQLR